MGWKRVAIGVVTIVAVASCGARTELGHRAFDAGLDGETHIACSYCGAHANELASCTLLASCPDESPDDANVCDGTHQLQCSCSTGTCTCSSKGHVSTVAFSSCPCDVAHFGDTELAQALVSSCGF